MLYMGRHLSIKPFFLSFLFSCKMATKLKLQRYYYIATEHQISKNCTLQWGDNFLLLVNPYWVSHSQKSVLYIGAQPSELSVDRVSWTNDCVTNDYHKNCNIIRVDLKPQGRWESSVNTQCHATRYSPSLRGKYLEAKLLRYGEGKQGI